MRASILAVSFLCLAGSAVEAKPSPYGVTQFSGDRYIAHAEPQKRPVVRQRYSSKVRYYYRAKRAPASRARPMRADPPLTFVGGLAREVSRAVVGSRPGHCPVRSWCGCWLASHLGMSNPRPLWLARNWARVGSPVMGRGSAPSSCGVITSGKLPKSQAIASASCRAMIAAPSAIDGARRPA
jgi:hypothetical protein